MKDRHSSVSTNTGQRLINMSDEAHIILDHDHQKRSALHYEKLQLNAVNLPSFKKKRHTINDQLVENGRRRFEEKKMAELKKVLSEQNKAAVKAKYSKPDPSKGVRDYPKRYIYFVVDGQDVLNS